jgi:hypothetical protein
MPLFEVMTPRGSDDPLETIIVRDGFCWSAALMPPLWALIHGLWLEGFGWLVGLVLIVVAGLFVGDEAAIWLYVVFALWIGFTAADLRVDALRREGYRLAGIRVAEDEFMAERDWLLGMTK